MKKQKISKIEQTFKKELWRIIKNEKNSNSMVRRELLGLKKIPSQLSG